MSVFTLTDVLREIEAIDLIKTAKVIVGRDSVSNREILLFSSSGDTQTPTLETERDVTFSFRLRSPERDQIRELIRDIKGVDLPEDIVNQDEECNSGDEPTCPDCGSDSLTGYARDAKKFTCDDCGSQFQYHGNGEYSE